MSPYTLWRDLVSDCSGRSGSSGSGPFPYTLWRDLVSDCSGRSGSSGSGPFPYALWRDLVSDGASSLRGWMYPPCFHTHFGVTWFPTVLADLARVDLVRFHAPCGVTWFPTTAGI